MTILLSVFISLLAPVLILIGDWICNVCAKNIGMNVGIEGHEWEVEDDEEMEATQNKPLVIDDSDIEDDDEEKEATQNKPLIIDDSDDDDEIAPVQKNKRHKRKILETLESDSGSESEGDNGSSHKRLKEGNDI
mmetsp:Transcript_1464/g.2661  ORF Transcript_1464/g.2661 Transcript_1464/m.2661 type:complete len:134 (-) Transcript_1464:60-461(-)